MIKLKLLLTLQHWHCHRLVALAHPGLDAWLHHLATPSRPCDSALIDRFFPRSAPHANPDCTGRTDATSAFSVNEQNIPAVKGELATLLAN